MLLVLHNMLELTLIAKMNKNIILLLCIMPVDSIPLVGDILYSTNVSSSSVLQNTNTQLSIMPVDSIPRVGDILYSTNVSSSSGVIVVQNTNTQLSIISIPSGTWVIQATILWNISYGAICSAISSSNTINSDPHCATTTFANTENFNNTFRKNGGPTVQGSYQTLQRVVQVVNYQTFNLIGYSYSCNTSVNTNNMFAIKIA